MIETTLVDAWLYTKLSSDATITSLVAARIYGYTAPPTPTFPYIIFNHQGSADVSAVGGYRIFNSGVYQVKAVAQSTSAATAKTIADRIDTLLQRAYGTVTGGYVLGCVREQPLVYVEITNGIQYRNLGGLYRIYVQGA